MIASPASSNRLKKALATAKVMTAIAPNVPVGTEVELMVWPTSIAVVQKRN